jgi:hypothetical protein
LSHIEGETMRARTIICAAGAALLLTHAVGTASANRLSVSNKRFRMTWPFFTVSSPEGGFHVVCPLTLEGSLHAATFTKLGASLVGLVTRATIGPCSEGNATVLTATLPWHLRYWSFSGPLPSIASIRLALAGMALQVEPGLGVLCLVATSASTFELVELRREAGGNLTFAAFEGFTIPFRRTNPECPAAAVFSGTGEVWALESLTRIALTLA